LKVESKEDLFSINRGPLNLSYRGAKLRASLNTHCIVESVKVRGGYGDDIIH
jgi:hypothetical protein